MGTRTRMAGIACGMLLSTVALSANDPVLEWNAIMLQTTAGQNPFFQARFAAIAQLAVFEAVNAIDKDFDPYLGTITAPASASAEAAAVAAAHRVLKNYFPASAAALDAARDTSLAAIRDGIRKQEGIAVGEAAAAAMIALRANDGSAPPEFHMPSSAAPGEWQATPSCPPAGGILLQWRNLRPFAIETTDQFRSGPPPALKSKRYARDYNEVKRVGSVDSMSRPQDRADVTRFYAATAPVPVWNAAASQVAVEQNRSMSESARVLALVNMAISDAQASVFETKYHYRFWRPETAIRAGDTDGNLLTRGKPDFMPFVLTPCFPSYGSAHGASSGAAREVLERVFGARHHSITLSNPAVAGVVLQYGAFRQITSDIDDARVYGGIHFRFDQESGAKLGRQVGAYVYRNTLRRTHGGGASECW
jgi:PAP2 superfamily